MTFKKNLWVTWMSCGCLNDFCIGSWDLLQSLDLSSSNDLMISTHPVGEDLNDPSIYFFFVTSKGTWFPLPALDERMTA